MQTGRAIRTGRGAEGLSLSFGQEPLLFIRFESVAAFSAFKDMGTDESLPLHSSIHAVIEFILFPTPEEQGIFSPCPSI